MAGTRYARSNSCSRARAPARSSSPWAAPARPTVSRPPFTRLRRAAAPCWRNSHSPRHPRAAPWPPPAGHARRSSCTPGRGPRSRSRCLTHGVARGRAARVAPRIVANRWRAMWLARGAARLLARHDIRLPDPPSRLPLVVVDGLGEGYGHPTPEGEAAERLASEHGLTLDPTYGAKAFAF